MNPAGGTASRDDEEVTITMKRLEWLVVLAAARDYNVRVPREQGDGGACLDQIEKAIA